MTAPTTPERLTIQRRMILTALHKAGQAGLYGVELTQITGLSTGTTSPALTALRTARVPLVEDVDPHHTPKPGARRYTRITEAGSALVESWPHRIALPADRCQA